MKVIRLTLVGLLMSFMMWGAGCQPFKRELEQIYPTSPEPTGEIAEPTECTNDGNGGCLVP